MHYVARVTITKVEDGVPARNSMDEAKRGSVTELASIAVQHSSLPTLVQVVQAHLELVSEV